VQLAVAVAWGALPDVALVVLVGVDLGVGVVADALHAIGETVFVLWGWLAGRMQAAAAGVRTSSYRDQRLMFGYGMKWKRREGEKRRRGGKIRERERGC
jgi:hypothetical protein